MRDIVEQAKLGGYLAFATYTFLRSVRSDIPNYSFITHTNSTERTTLLAAAEKYVVAACRVSNTQPFIQTLRRAMTTDVNQEHFCQDLSSFTTAERVFTGVIYHGCSKDVTTCLTRQISKLETYTLSADVRLLLLALNSIALDKKYDKISNEQTQNLMWPKLLHQLHMEGNIEAAAMLMKHMETL